MKKFFQKCWLAVNFGLAILTLAPILFVCNRVVFFRIRIKPLIISRLWAKWLFSVTGVKYGDDHLDMHTHRYWIFLNLGIATTVLGIPLLALGMFDRKKKIGHFIARFWAKWILWIIGVEYQVIGLENIQKHEQYVFVVNHQSLLDILIVYLGIPNNTSVLAKKEVYRVPLFGQAIRALGIIRVDRQNTEKRGESVIAAIHTLNKRGQSIISFVEGTRSRTGELGRFKTGGYRIALALGLPIVPVTIIGTREVLLPDTLCLNKESKVAIIFGQPIQTKDLMAPIVNELTETTKKIILENLK